MLERNVLAHFKLGLLLSLLSASILLHARLPAPTPDSTDSNNDEDESKAGLPMAIILGIAALTAIAAGLWEYWSGSNDLIHMRAFLVASKYVPDLYPFVVSCRLMHSRRPHSAMLTVVAGVVLSTCIILLADKQQL